MTIAEFLKAAEAKLQAVGIGSARLDSLILLEDELGKDRAWILANLKHEISATALKKLSQKLTRRTKHEPLAYIRGFTEFYGRKFIINKDVLEPRPESETMIEMLLELPSKSIADIGTGSGALAITAKLEIPKTEVIGTDIDPKCLELARQNAVMLQTDVKFYKRDLLTDLPTKPDVILANLPYVPNKWKINEAAAMEPKIAIFGGPDGLDIYRGFFEQIKQTEKKSQYILTESLPPQHEKLTAIATSAGYELAKIEDFIQLFACG